MNRKTRSARIRKNNWKQSRTTLVFILGLLVILTFGCKLFNNMENSEEPKFEDKLEIETKLGKENFRQLTGYFYKNYDNKKVSGVSFHLANYDLYSDDPDALKSDLAFEQNQVKVNFGFKKEKFDKMQDLIGEFKSTGADKVYVFPVIYSDKGFVVFDTFTSNGTVEIKEIKDGIARGTIDYSDDDGNSIKGTFTAKAIGEELEKFVKDEKENSAKE